MVVSQYIASFFPTQLLLELQNLELLELLVWLGTPGKVADIMIIAFMGLEETIGVGLFFVRLVLRCYD